MGLIDKIFGGGTHHPAGNSKLSEFRDSIVTTEQAVTPTAPRRELVQVVLHQTMRKHGIPSDWLDCRILSVVKHRHKPGMHVQFLVRRGDEQLLQYLHAFQESFWEEIEKFEPQARQWLFSVGWEFYARSTRGFSPMPAPEVWAQSGDTHPQPGDTLIEGEDAQSIESDLQALQAVMSRPAELGDLPATPTGRRRVPDELLP